MTDIWYTATEKFDPSFGEAWTDYVAWAGLPQLKELLTLDGMRTAGELANVGDEDWEHNVQEDYRLHFFRDLEYVLKRFAHARDAVNILAAVLEPEGEAPSLLHDERFGFAGYDLLGDGMSTINNVSGFEQAFRKEDVSPVGLFDSYELARQVQRRLRELYPGEHHSDCELWALWRLREGI